MITGRLPFRAETEIALLYQIVHEEPDLSSPPLSPSVASVLSRALSKDPGQRPPSAAALVRELEKAASEGVPPVAESTRQRSPSGGRVWLGAVLGLLLGFILGFPAGWYLGRQGETAGGSLGTTPTATTSTLLPSWLTPPLTEGVTLSPMPTTSAPTRRIPTSTPIPPTPTPTPRPPATPTPTPTPGG
jgi:serine/threonine protein kinase